MKNLQKQVDEWIARFEEGYWPPLTNLARLMEEVGELSRIMNHSFGSKYKKPEEQEQKLSEESSGRDGRRPTESVRPGA